MSRLRAWIARRFGRAPAPAETARMRAGRWGEEQAARYLRRAGYRILGRRVRTAPREEIDLVAARGDTLAFVEVKTRASESFGAPAEAVDRAKRRRLSRAACRYLVRMRRPPPYARLDIVEVIGSPDTPAPEIRHFADAYPMEGPWRPPSGRTPR